MARSTKVSFKTGGEGDLGKAAKKVPYEHICEVTPPPEWNLGYAFKYKLALRKGNNAWCLIFGMPYDDRFTEAHCNEFLSTLQAMAWLTKEGTEL